MKFKHLRLPVSNEQSAACLSVLALSEKNGQMIPGNKFNSIRPGVLTSPNKSRMRFILRCATLSIFLLLVCLSGSVRAQSINASINIISVAPPRLKVEGTRPLSTDVWSFRNTYASVIGIGERIENFTLADAQGANVPVRKLAPGEWKADGAATRFSYEVKLDSPLMATDAAYVSWLTNDYGFLMLGDLLPLSTGNDGKATTARLNLALPPAWSVGSTETKGTSSGRYEIKDTERAIFFVGRSLREKRASVGATDFAFMTTGEWAFTDEDAARMATSILKEHAETFGGAAQGRAMLVLAPFPRPMGAERWSAETRGRTVVLLSGRAPSKTAALARLSVPFTHELFHLWVPNRLALDGDYDWFYEGFTMYQAMRAAGRLNLLEFQDFLNGIGRAFDAYRSASDRDRFSLLDSSRQRWTGSPALIYNKGMLVAFLYDLMVRQKTGGKRSLDDVYRQLFRQHRETEARADGNTAVLSALNETADMREFTRQYVEGASAIDLATMIAPFGLRVESGGVRTHVLVADSLKREQRDLLRKFGYNAESRTGLPHGRQADKQHPAGMN
jgi:predicted metalloprotease with PDZ domain